VQSLLSLFFSGQVAIQGGGASTAFRSKIQFGLMYCFSFCLLLK